MWEGNLCLKPEPFIPSSANFLSNRIYLTIWSKQKADSLAFLGWISSYSLEGTILCSHTERHSASQASHPARWLNDCKTALSLLLPIFSLWPHVRQREIPRLLLLATSCLLLKDTSDAWLPFTSHLSTVSQSSSHVDLLESSKTNSEPFPVSGTMHWVGQKVYSGFSTQSNKLFGQPNTRSLLYLECSSSR